LARSSAWPWPVSSRSHSSEVFDPTSKCTVLVRARLSKILCSGGEPVPRVILILRLYMSIYLDSSANKMLFCSLANRNRDLCKWSSYRTHSWHSAPLREERSPRAAVAVLATRCVVFGEDLLMDVASTRPNPGALHCPCRNSYGVVVIDDGVAAGAGIMLAPSNQL
jgi:hypothetical protein